MKNSKVFGLKVLTKKRQLTKRYENEKLKVKKHLKLNLMLLKPDTKKLNYGAL